MHCTLHSSFVESSRISAERHNVVYSRARKGSGIGLQSHILLTLMILMLLLLSHQRAMQCLDAASDTIMEFYSYRFCPLLGPSLWSATMLRLCICSQLQPNALQLNRQLRTILALFVELKLVRALEV